MSETFPEHSNERRNVVRCLSDVTVFPEEGVVPLHNTSEAVKERNACMRFNVPSVVRGTGT